MQKQKNGELTSRPVPHKNHAMKKILGMILHFTDYSYLGALKERNDRVDFLAGRNLLLDLVDGIEDACLSVEHKTIGIGDVSDDLMLRS